MNKKIKKSKGILEEAQFIKQKELDYNLVKVLSGEWKGTKKEREHLNNLKKKLKDDIYTEAIYILTHKVIRDVKQAKELYLKVIEHKNHLTKKLKRNVGIEIATLDYMKNIENILQKPEVIEKDKLLKLATKAITDETTGIYDRGSFNSNLDAELERAKRYRRPLSLLFCDLDDFKKVNDKLGHNAGDAVLKKTVDVINKMIRATDSLYRYGGEEFVCILAETDLKSAAIIARRIRKSISDMSISTKTNKTKTKVTMSIGVVQFASFCMGSTQDFIFEADKMMYKAKQAGKNRVCVQDLNNGKAPAINISGDTSGKEKKRIVFEGQCISSGFALGKAFIYKDILTRDHMLYTLQEEDIEHELARLKRAFTHVLKDLNKIKKVAETDIGKEHAEIFEAHKAILQDETLLQDIKTELKKELINAEQVVKNVFRRWINKFKVSESEVVKARSDDLEDISRRILKVLLGYERNVLENLPANSIVVAKRLLPSDTVHLKRRNVKGIVVEKGSNNSHSAILSRALGIPAIANPNSSIDLINKKDVLLLDGKDGIAILNPNKNDIGKHEKDTRSAGEEREKLFKKAKKIAKTKDGERIFVYANASNREDFEKAVAIGCDGVGLFRIENIFLSSKTLPDEKYLIDNFTKILSYARTKEITIRLLDIGGDKKLPYMKINDEANPFLGSRGIRLLLDFENLLRTQLKAMFMLSSKFKIRILIPMVTFAREIKRVKEIANECCKELEKSRNRDFKGIKIGSMIETPAAVINLKEIAKESDFLSIGTNDLIQYTMAAGRGNESVSDYYDEGPGIIAGTIESIIDTARQFNIECNVCGEIAGDLNWTKMLVKAGARHFSVSPLRIPPLKEKIKDIRL